MYANKVGLKYLHGVECYLTASLDEKVRDNYHTILIAKNKDGIREVNSLVDLSTQEDHFYYKPRITFEEFFNISDNVIKISACLASPLSKYPCSTNAIQEELNQLKKEAKENIALVQKAASDALNDENAFQEWIELFFNNGEETDIVIPPWETDRFDSPRAAYEAEIEESLNKVVNEYNDKIWNLKKKITKNFCKSMTITRFNHM